MAAYEVWATNNRDEWEHCLLETDDRTAAIDKAQRLVDARRFHWVAIDHKGETIWSNDPDTPAVAD